MKYFTRFLLACLLIPMLAAACSGTDAISNNDTGLDEADAAEPASYSHSSDTDPDYAIVFPDDEVNQIIITISPDNWEAVFDDMTGKYGSFGSGGQMGDGGFGGQPSGGGRGGMMDGQDDENPIWVEATIEFEDEIWEHVGFRLKGNSSLKNTWSSGSYKLPFKLDFDEFEDSYEEIDNQRFYGFKQISFSSNFKDASYLREKISADIFREAGVPSAQTAYYAVYVDYGEGPVYFGLYTAVEVVDDTVIQIQFEDDSGNVYKPSDSAATFAADTYNEAQYDKETNKDEDDYSDLEALLEALHADLRTSDAEAWRAELESVLDVDAFLRWLSANTVMQNWDTYGSMSHNYYLYHDPASDQLVWIPWDNNQSLSSSMGGGGGIDRGGNMNRVPGNAPTDAQKDENAEQPEGANVDARAANPGANRGMIGRENSSIGLEDIGDNWPLISYLLADEVTRQKYDEYVEAFITDVFNADALEPVVTETHDMIAEYVEAEQEGYTTLSDYDAFESSVSSLLAHITSRYNAALEYLADADS